MFWPLCRVVCLLALTALLSLPVCAAVAESNKLFRNKNAQALPLGLTFHPDVPNNIRKAIIEDLDWLSTRGPIKDERLRYLLQIDEPMTGASLVAWFLDRVHVVGVFGWCPRNDFAVIRFDSGNFAITKMRGECPPLSNARAAVSAATFVRDPGPNTVQAIAVDRKVRIIPETWPNGFRWPTMVVSPTFVRGEPSTRERVIRLASLLHEASHVEAITHGTCTTGDWRQGPYAIGPIKLPVPSFGIGQRNCDDANAGSAFTIEASFFRAIAEVCNCSSQERMRINFHEWVAWSYQGVHIKEPVVVPSSGDLTSIKGLGGKTLYNFPPAEFMEAGLEYIDAASRICQNRCTQAEELRSWRRQLVALRDYGRELNKRGAFAGSWQSSNPNRRPLKRPLDVAGAKKWLAAATKAAKDGYNVETISLVSCADLQGQC